MHKPHVRRWLAAALASTLLLAGCGGGGGGGDNTIVPLGPPPSTRFGASSSFANICTLDSQRRFIRSYMDEVYLWYNEIPRWTRRSTATFPTTSTRCW
jgi:hypothetical protein